VPFHFPLQSALRLRRSQQRQQELLVQRANEQMNRAAQRLRAIDREITQLLSGYRKCETRGAELQFVEAQCRVLEDSRRRTQFELTKARERHSELVATLRKIWQQREVLEALYKREYELHLSEQGRREQATQDDLFLVRTRNGHRLPS
jgi:flagellar biosynthesis chaperone FliJ